MFTTKILDLKRIVLEHNGLILYDDLYNLLHHDRSKAPKVFETILRNSLLKFAETYPNKMKVYVGGSMKSYTFHSNFDQYLAGNIPESEIILPAISVYYVKGWMSVNSQWWQFFDVEQTIKFKLSSIVNYISYHANYPLVINYGPDGDFTEDSTLYYLDIYQDKIFLTFLSYFVLRYIRNLNMSVDMNHQVSFLKNLDQILSEVQQQYEEYQDARSYILEMWRK